MRFNKDRSLNWRKNLILWIGSYSVWFVWESAFRILLHHRDWSLLESFRYMGINLAYGVSWAVILSLGYSTLLLLVTRSEKLQRLHGLLLPQAAAILTALVSVPVLFAYRNYLTHTTTSMLFRWCTAAALLLFLYGVIATLVKRLPVLRLSARWLFIFSFLLSFLVVTAFSLSQDQNTITPSDNIRHIVLISIDTLRHDNIGAYGATRVQTPVMDSIAAEGIRFEQAISSITLTGPSHVTMFTGQSPLKHGIRLNGQPLPHGFSTIAGTLRNAGFRTAAFISGYTLKNINCGLNQGFQVYDERLSYLDLFNETFYGRIPDTLPFVSLGMARPATKVTASALKWLESNYDAPFFLFVHYYDPHFPYGAKDQERFTRALGVDAGPEDLPEQKRLYAREVERVDRHIGKIVDLLKRKGMYDQTLILITADHGEELGEHGSYYNHDRGLYDELLRVPMIIRCPPLIQAGEVFSKQVALLDLHRTILGAAGLTPSPETGGYDLIHAVQKPDQYPDRVVMSHNFARHFHGLRTDGWKLIRKGREAYTYELYNLKKDPGELNNVWKEEPQVFVEFKTTLEEMLSSAVDREDWNSDQLTPEQIERLRSLGYTN